MINFILILPFFLLYSQTVNSCMRTNLKQRSRISRETPIIINVDKFNSTPVSYHWGSSGNDQLLFNFKVSVACKQTYDRHPSDLFSYYLNNTDIQMPANAAFLDFEVVDQETGNKWNTSMPKQLFEGSDNGSETWFQNRMQRNKHRLFCFSCEHNPHLARDGKGKTFREQLIRADYESILHFLKQQEKLLDTKTINNRD